MFEKTLTNTGIQIGGKIVTVLMSLVTTGILVRRLGVIDYGFFSLVSSVLILVDSLADFGTRVIGVREASRAGSETGRAKVFKTVLMLRLVMAGLAFGLALAWLWGYPGLAGIRNEVMLALMMIGFTSLTGSLEIVFQTKLRMDLKTIMDVVFPGLFLVYLLNYSGGMGLGWVFGTYLGARIISLGLGLVLADRVWSLDQLKGIGVSRSDMWRLVKEAWPMGVYLIVFTGYDRAVDSMMINHFWGAREVAWYGLAYKIYTNLIMPAYFFVSNVFPLLSRKETDQKRLYKRSLTVVTTMALGVMGIMFVLAPLAITILAGEGFEMSVGVLRILLGALIFSYLGHVIGFTLISRGGQKELLAVGLTALVFNIVLNAVMIPRYGIMGAAGVTIATEALGMGLMKWKLDRKLETRNKKLE